MQYVILTAVSSSENTLPVILAQCFDWNRFIPMDFGRSPYENGFDQHKQNSTDLFEQSEGDISQPGANKTRTVCMTRHHLGKTEEICFLIIWER